ncbi:tyrosine-protein phosphatase [Actinocorallia longicatena]|uniref:Tyrosine-protein phosphatase n=1 Tax=Actinocorallia longicatena TaxID=111803 RepID=A0ABP6Q8Y7_9ACTN
MSKNRVAAAALTAVMIGAGTVAVSGPAIAAPSAKQHFARHAVISEAVVTLDAAGVHEVSWKQVRGLRTEVFASTDPDVPRGDRVRVASGRGTTVRVAGLDPASRWYFLIAPVGVPFGEIAATRVVPVQGAANVRDLGGYTTRDGLAVRWGRVFRSAKLSKAGPASLAPLGLSAAIDFRSPSEVAGDGADVLPAGVRPVAAPIAPGDANSPLTALASLATLTPQQVRDLLGDGKGARAMEQVYRLIVTDEAARRALGDTLRTLLASRRPVLYHCTAGKDRTGVMTAVLLKLLGVPKETVYADFLRSNDELAAGNAQTLAYLRSKGIDADLLVPVLGVQASYLDAAFTQIDTSYGSFSAFLAKGLGFGPAQQAALKIKLLRPQA